MRILPKALLTGLLPARQPRAARISRKMSKDFILDHCSPQAVAKKYIERFGWWGAGRWISRIKDEKERKRERDVMTEDMITSYEGS